MYPVAAAFDVATRHTATSPHIRVGRGFSPDKIIPRAKHVPLRCFTSSMSSRSALSSWGSEEPSLCADFLAACAPAVACPCLAAKQPWLFLKRASIAVARCRSSPVLSKTAPRRSTSLWVGASAPTKPARAKHVAQRCLSCSTRPRSAPASPGAKESFRCAGSLAACTPAVALNVATARFKTKLAQAPGRRRNLAQLQPNEHSLPPK